MVLLQGFEPFSVQTQAEPAVRIHGLKWTNASSSLPPLLLLHGFPQNLHMWHRVAPQLVGQYNVILIDIRGYGQSSAPAEVSAYAKSAMARDCIAVMDSLGFTESFYVCSHDRGARVAHKLCVDYPSRVKKAILLDICPTLAMYTKTDFNFASAYFHWFMLIQDEPLPETFLSGPARPVMELLLMKGHAEAGSSIFDEACFDSYLENLRHPATIHAMCNDYRAGATYDLEEAREDLKNDRLVKCPLLIIWGKQGVIEKYFKATEEWRAVTDASVPVSGYSVDSGHFIPEEAPESVLSAINDFFG
ncbi:Alpha/Beta hydrolase protein [Penicillium hispanicum]|uniref:Alpha/Beta hydrolase protein n=1 Tax=Penicillium hispanicum TaxID=1080232 RepID=UPI00254126B3|nr:Alpha/Beta hydrolase protein [Penicillium hispanicum]KAJ5586773.1 Alpha/Beta hydrolase protein [Penicillium hispanicum]